MIDFALLFLSFDYDTQDELIKLMLDSKVLEEAEQKQIKDYQKICDSISKKPSLELLTQKFPTLDFNGKVPLDFKRLDEEVRLIIQRKRDDNSASALMKLSAMVKKDGITSEILDEILALTKSDSKNKSTYSDILKDNKIKELYKAASIEKGISTGIKTIDKLTGGLQPGTFNCLAGFAGAGKTTAAVNIAYNAIKDGKNVCYLTLEVPKIDMFYNFGSRHSFESKFRKSISHSDVKKKELSEDDANYFFDEVMPDLNNLPGKIYILDETEIDSYTFASFENKIREIDKLATEATGEGISLLVVDQAQLLKFSSNMSTAGMETSVINLYVSFFRQQAINFLRTKRPCTILMLSQINREGFTYASKHGGKYSLTNLAEANELERASAMVISLFTDESLKISKQCQVQLLKSRNGQTMVEPALTFMDPVYYAFGDLIEGSGTMFEGGYGLEQMLASTQTLDLNIKKPLGTLDSITMEDDVYEENAIS